jgi:hypothetical protein
MHTVIALSGKGTVLNAIGYALREKLLDEPEEFAGVSDYPRDDAHFDIVMVLLTRTTARNVRTLYALLGTIRAGGHRGDEEVDPTPLIVKPFVYMCDPWNRMLVPIHVHEHNKYPPFLKPSINVGVPHDDRNLYVLFPTREIRDTSVDHSFGSENAFIPICDNSLMYYVMGTRHEKWEKLPSSFQVHRSVICRLLKMYQCCTWATIVCLISPPPQAWVSEQILSAVQVAFKYQRSTKAK